MAKTFRQEVTGILQRMVSLRDTELYIDPNDVVNDICSAAKRMGERMPRIETSTKHHTSWIKCEWDECQAHIAKECND